MLVEQESALKVLKALEQVGDTEARYSQFGISPDYVAAADGRRVPAVVKGVFDYGPHDARSGVGGVRVIPPQARVFDRGKIHAQHAPVLAAAPHTHPGTPGRAELCRPFELRGPNAQGADSGFHASALRLRKLSRLAEILA